MGLVGTEGGEQISRVTIDVDRFDAAEMPIHGRARWWRNGLPIWDRLADGLAEGVGRRVHPVILSSVVRCRNLILASCPEKVPSVWLEEFIPRTAGSAEARGAGPSMTV